MADVDLISQVAMNQVISHLDGVVMSVRSQAQKIGSKAKAKLAAHRDEGDAKITITHGDVDSFVNLEDKAALSIEFGHWQYINGQPTGKYTPGLYIITGAAGLF